MSRFVATGRGQYPQLFRDRHAYGAWSDSGPNNGRDESDFARRFGIARLYNRNKNLLQVLENPTQALTDVNEDIAKVAKKGTDKYQEYLQEFRGLGFGEEEAQARADIMIGRDLENEIALLQLKAPYAVGGAEAGGWDPVSAALAQNPGFGQNGISRTMRAINSTHLGVGEIKGRGRIGKGEKLRLKKKFKRKRRGRK